MKKLLVFCCIGFLSCLAFAEPRMEEISKQLETLSQKQSELRATADMYYARRETDPDIALEKLEKINQVMAENKIVIAMLESRKDQISRELSKQVVSAPVVESSPPVTKPPVNESPARTIQSQPSHTYEGPGWWSEHGMSLLWGIVIFVISGFTLHGIYLFAHKAWMERSGNTSPREVISNRIQSIRASFQRRIREFSGQIGGLFGRITGMYQSRRTIPRIYSPPAPVIPVPRPVVAPPPAPRPVAPPPVVVAPVPPVTPPVNPVPQTPPRPRRPRTRTPRATPAAPAMSTPTVSTEGYNIARERDRLRGVTGTVREGNLDGRINFDDL